MDSREPIPEAWSTVPPVCSSLRCAFPSLCRWTFLIAVFREKFESSPLPLLRAGGLVKNRHGGIKREWLVRMVRNKKAAVAGQRGRVRGALLPADNTDNVTDGRFEASLNWLASARSTPAVAPYYYSNSWWWSGASTIGYEGGYSVV